MTPIYLDNHASTPVDPRVLKVLTSCCESTYGNAASRTHALGFAALDALSEARVVLADFLGAHASEIVFTSGATESNDLALSGVVGDSPEGQHVVISAIEHSSVIATAEWLSRRGARVTVVPSGRDGILELDSIVAALTDTTRLVSVQAANNEIGTIQPFADIGKEVHARGAVFHVDAAQALGRVPIDVEAHHIDLLSVSAHKVYAPKGIGALYVRGGSTSGLISPRICGGGQEGGLRAGTVNVPGAVAFAAAIQILAEQGDEENDRIARLRDRLLHHLTNEFRDLQVHGSLTHRLPGNLSFRIPGVTTETVLGRVPDLCLSATSACHAGANQRSHVLAAIGLTDQEAGETLRVGVGRFNTSDEIERAGRQIVAAARSMNRRRLDAGPAD